MRRFFRRRRPVITSTTGGDWQMRPEWVGKLHHPECSSVAGPGFEWCDCYSLPTTIATRVPPPPVPGVLARLDEGGARPPRENDHPRRDPVDLLRAVAAV